MVHMKTLYCPECETPLKLLTKGEYFEGWRRCQKCDELSRVIATASEEFSIQSLSHILKELNSEKIGIQALQYIQDHGTALEKDIEFCVGKRSRIFLDLLTNVEVLDRENQRYRIKEPFQEPISEFIATELSEKSYNRREISKKNRISV